jgi:hypothetical protein
MTMQNHVNSFPIAVARSPWNKGKLTGAKPPLQPKHVWAIRTKLQVEGRPRDLAMFNLAIDSKLRGCDLVALKVENVAPGGYTGATTASERDLNPWTPRPLVRQGTKAMIRDHIDHGVHAC